MLRPFIRIADMRPLGSMLLLATIAIAPTARGQFAKVDACSLLTASEASKAIEVPVDKGHHLIEPSKGECWWSDAETADSDHRRVTLSIISSIGFDRPKASNLIQTEPVSGVGDEAYYIVQKSAVPILNVRKGTAYFQIKVLNGFKVKPPLKADDVKARELVLAKAAVGKL